MSKSKKRTLNDYFKSQPDDTTTNEPPAKKQKKTPKKQTIPSKQVGIPRYDSHLFTDDNPGPSTSNNHSLCNTININIYNSLFPT